MHLTEFKSKDAQWKVNLLPTPLSASSFSSQKQTSVTSFLCILPQIFSAYTNLHVPMYAVYKYLSFLFFGTVVILFCTLVPAPLKKLFHSIGYILSLTVLFCECTEPFWIFSSLWTFKLLSVFNFVTNSASLTLTLCLTSK